MSYARRLEVRCTLDRYRTSFLWGASALFMSYRRLCHSRLDVGYFAGRCMLPVVYSFSDIGN